MNRFTIWVKYMTKCAGTLVWDGVKLFVSWLVQLIGVFAIIDALLYMGEANRLYSHDRLATAAIIFERLPLVLAIQAWGWVVFLLGKQLRCPEGWRSWTWKNFFWSLITAGSTNELMYATELSRRLHLEAIARQDRDFDRFRTQRRVEIARAARTLEATRAYQATLATYRTGPPCRGYAVSLAAVILSTALSASASAIKSGNSALVGWTGVTVKHGLATASVAAHMTCHPPPSSRLVSCDKLNSLVYETALAAPPPSLELALQECEDFLRRIWCETRSLLPDPPWKSIEHIPILVRAT